VKDDDRENGAELDDFDEGDNDHAGMEDLRGKEEDGGGGGGGG
jgi:hypothetical protein